MLSLTVKFTKIGNKIKYQLPVKMFCTRMNEYVANSMTLDKNDLVITGWLGNNVNDLFKIRNTIYKKVDIGQVYDDCDIPKSN